jgi:hypothetical protein
LEAMATYGRASAVEAGRCSSQNRPQAEATCGGSSEAVAETRPRKAHQVVPQCSGNCKSGEDLIRFHIRVFFRAMAIPNPPNP